MSNFEWPNLQEELVSAEVRIRENGSFTQSDPHVIVLPTNASWDDFFALIVVQCGYDPQTIIDSANIYLIRQDDWKLTPWDTQITTDAVLQHVMSTVGSFCRLLVDLKSKTNEEGTATDEATPSSNEEKKRYRGCGMRPRPFCRGNFSGPRPFINVDVAATATAGEGSAGEGSAPCPPSPPTYPHPKPPPFCAPTPGSGSAPGSGYDWSGWWNRPPHHGNRGNGCPRFRTRFRNNWCHRPPPSSTTTGDAAEANSGAAGNGQPQPNPSQFWDWWTSAMAGGAATTNRSSCRFGPPPPQTWFGFGYPPASWPMPGSNGEAPPYPYPEQSRREQQQQQTSPPFYEEAGAAEAKSTPPPDADGEAVLSEENTSQTATGSNDAEAAKGATGATENTSDVSKGAAKEGATEANAADTGTTNATNSPNASEGQGGGSGTSHQGPDISFPLFGGNVSAEELIRNILEGVYSAGSDISRGIDRTVSILLKGDADGVELGSGRLKMETSDTVHEGVVCDKCERDIVGVRFKCGHCANYDLCEECELSGQSGSHPKEHIFLKLRLNSPRLGYHPEKKKYVPLLKKLARAEFVGQEQQQKKKEKLAEDFASQQEQDQESAAKNAELQNQSGPSSIPTGPRPAVVSETLQQATNRSNNQARGAIQKAKARKWWRMHPPRPSNLALKVIDHVSLESTSTLVAPGETITKIWKVRNTGQTQWTRAEARICSTEQFHFFTTPPSAIIKLPDLLPGEQSDVAVTFKIATANNLMRKSKKTPTTFSNTCEVDGKKTQPVSSTPINGTPWCVVWTGDDNVFYYNSSKRTSVWERPSDLMTRDDVTKLIATPPQRPKGEVVQIQYQAFSKIARNCWQAFSSAECDPNTSLSIQFTLPTPTTAAAARSKTGSRQMRETEAKVGEEYSSTDEEAGEEEDFVLIPACFNLSKSLDDSFDKIHLDDVLDDFMDDGIGDGDDSSNRTRILKPRQKVKEGAANSQSSSVVAVDDMLLLRRPPSPHRSVQDDDVTAAASADESFLWEYEEQTFEDLVLDQDQTLRGKPEVTTSTPARGGQKEEEEGEEGAEDELFSDCACSPPSSRSKLPLTTRTEEEKSAATAAVPQQVEQESDNILINREKSKAPFENEEDQSGSGRELSSDFPSSLATASTTAAAASSSTGVTTYPGDNSMVTHLLSQQANSEQIVHQLLTQTPQNVLNYLAESSNNKSMFMFPPAASDPSVNAAATANVMSSNTDTDTSPSPPLGWVGMSADEKCQKLVSLGFGSNDEVYQILRESNYNFNMSKETLETLQQSAFDDFNTSKNK